MRWRIVRLGFIGFIIMFACAILSLGIVRNMGEPPLVYTQYSFSISARYFTFIDPFREQHYETTEVLHVQPSYLPPLTPDGSPDLWKAVSPDGRYSVRLGLVDGFTRLLIADENGERILTEMGNILPIREQVIGSTRTTLDALWSPGGEWIAFLANDDRNIPGFFIIRPDGTDLRRIAYGFASSQRLDVAWVVWREVGGVTGDEA